MLNHLAYTDSVNFRYKKHKQKPFILEGFLLPIAQRLLNIRNLNQME